MNSIQSQLSSDSSITEEDDKTPSLDIASNYIQRFLNRVGHEIVTPSVFDPNNRGVDYFFLPVFYCPQQGGISVSHLDIHNNMYIADRYLIKRQLGHATFSVTVECIDMKGELNKRLCLKVGIVDYSDVQIIKNGDLYFDQSLDEIRILRYLNRMKEDHSTVLQLYDFFYYNQHLIIVTEVEEDDMQS